MASKLLISIFWPAFINEGHIKEPIRYTISEKSDTIQYLGVSIQYLLNLPIRDGALARKRHKWTAEFWNSYRFSSRFPIQVTVSSKVQEIVIIYKKISIHILRDDHSICVWDVAWAENFLVQVRAKLFVLNFQWTRYINYWDKIFFILHVWARIF